jgi:GNAT superfamily N-acetyltransferase
MDGNGSSSTAPTGAWTYERVALRFKGFNDEQMRYNNEVRAAITVLARMFDDLDALDMRVAESEQDMQEALKLYRDMNHLSLAGGITCEQVIQHVQSTTILLFYTPPDTNAPIPVTAATFSLRAPSTMMLRLLATHPRMTRKGFARVTVHFLKELCRALNKSDILVYTYPSSSSFYKALHFHHTNPHLQSQRPPPMLGSVPIVDVASESAATADAAPSDAPPASLQRSREEARDARRVFSAKENEMIFHVQPTLVSVLRRGVRADATGAHPYACTRRRAAPEAATSDAVRPQSPLPAAGRKAARESRRGSAGQGGLVAGCAKGRPPVIGLVPMEQPQDFGEHAACWQDAVKPMYASPTANGGALVPSTPPGDGSKLANGVGASGGELSDADGSGEPPPQKRRAGGDKEYVVQEILGVRSHEGQVQYLIKWKG